MVSLRTARLLLRPWRDEDMAEAAELSADPAVMEFLIPCPGWGERQRDHWRQHGFGQWVVELPGEASFIGAVGLSRIGYQAHFAPAVEIAWRLARAYWGKGYASEAARAALDFGFGELALAEIVAITNPANLRSRRVMERLAMTRSPQDDFDHPNVPDGPLKRCVLYRLRRKDQAA
ncbi:MAG: GNAT family N-acetyltransferase [Stellaceae bacterium]